MYRPLVITLLALTVHSSLARADSSADLRPPANEVRRSIKVKELAGGTVLALGIPALIAGVVLTGDGFFRSLGCLDGCTAAEDRAIHNRSIGAGLGVGLGAAAVVAGAITLSVAAQQRKAARRQLSFGFAPSASGASGMARVSF
jgi:hypothetical protein